MGESARRTAGLHEFGEGGHLCEITDAQGLRDLARLPAKGICCPKAPGCGGISIVGGGRSRRRRGALRRRRGPHGARHWSERVCREPRLHEDPQRLATEGEPALTL